MRVCELRSNSKNRAQARETNAYLLSFSNYVSDKYKEENWNLEVSLQELRQQHADTQATVQRLESEHKRLNKQLASSNDTAEQYKNENAQLQNNLEELTAKHETDVALARKHAAGLARDKSDLQQAVDKLKAEQDRAGRKFGRFGSPATPSGIDSPGGDDTFLTPANLHDDLFSNAASTNRRRDGSVLGDIMDGELSPDQSPASKSPFLAPNHPINEIEALKQKLAHAHRQITTLKGGLMRERMNKAKGVSIFDEEPEDDAFEDVDEEEVEDSPRPRVSQRRVARGRGRGHGRGRGSGGLTLAERMLATNSPMSVSELDDTSPARGGAVPPIHFQGADDDEMEDVVPDEDEDIFNEDAEPIEPPSNRTSVDGMDPAFANILRRTPSTNSIPPNTSPLHQSLLRRSTRPGPIGRRRGGSAFQDGNRPPSLVGHPEDLAAALGSSSPLRPDDSLHFVQEVETADFACQTEDFEEKTILPSKDLVDTATQSEPEPVVQRSTFESSMQTDVDEPIVTPELQDIAVSTDPEIVVPAPVLVQTEVQTSSAPTTQDADTQTPVEAVEDPFGRRSTLTPQDIVNWSMGNTPRPRIPSNTTVTRSSAPPRGFIGPPHQEEEDSDGQTETGAETETDMSDYQDARQSVMMSSTPSMSRDAFHDARQSMALSSAMSTSQEDFHSVMTMTDNEYEDEDDDDDDDDAESIKASRLSSSPAVPPFVPAVVYETKAIEVNIVDEPALPLPVPPPKPEVKEISIQTDVWSPPVPPAPPVSVPPTPAQTVFVPPVPEPLAPSPALYRVGTPAAQPFTFIPPPPPSSSPAVAASTQKDQPTGPLSGIVTPSANIFRETSNGFGSIRRQRTSTDSRRQSIESAMSSIYDDGPTPTNIVKPTPIDKTRPPTMMLPPPPRAPPPKSMPPPSFIPERRMPTLSGSSYDMAPPRPSSPPPPELIHRATTPTFGAALSIPRGTGQRQHGSSMPPMQPGLRQPPSTSSFRSAANAASYAQHSMGMSSFRTGRELSSTSLASDRSPRSSMSSDRHSFLAPAAQVPATPANRLNDLTNRPVSVNPTDPTVIHAITQTMIGEYLYKYTRKTIGKGYGERRHKRFFWVHPYTKTLYWSSADPGGSNVTESSAKSGMFLFFDIGYFMLIWRF